MESAGLEGIGGLQMYSNTLELWQRSADIYTGLYMNQDDGPELG